mmetsp:Transcript_3915/g.11717  ORF Transcript_3915/g.11717 Transcript_3915/m.11717 type:complete len:88 (+) Transcript_3915:835-1098(+)
MPLLISQHESTLCLSVAVAEFTGVSFDRRKKNCTSAADESGRRRHERCRPAAHIFIRLSLQDRLLFFLSFLFVRTQEARQRGRKSQS